MWDQVKALLEQPDRVAHEYRRRIAQAREGAAASDEMLRLDRQISSLRRGISRPIDSYAEGVIHKAEFVPRITGLKQRPSQLQERHKSVFEAAELERDLSLVSSRLEDFSAKVPKGSTVSTNSACGRLFARSSAVLKSTTPASRSFSESHRSMAVRDRPRRPKQTILGDIVAALLNGRWHRSVETDAFRALCPNRSGLRPPRHDPPHAQTPDKANLLLMNRIFPDRLLSLVGTGRRGNPQTQRNPAASGQGHRLEDPVSAVRQASPARQGRKARLSTSASRANSPPSSGPSRPTRWFGLLKRNRP